MRDYSLQIEHVKWAELKPHPDNPRNSDIEAIAASLTVNGQYKPLVVAADSTIIAGNHTYAAMGEIGMGTVAVVRLNLDPYSPEARRIMAADNRTSDMGQYDDGLLLALLRGLDEADGGLIGTGYDPDDIEDLETLLEYQGRIALDGEERHDVGEDLRERNGQIQAIYETVQMILAEVRTIHALVAASDKRREEERLTALARETMHGAED